MLNSKKRLNITIMGSNGCLLCASETAAAHPRSKLRGIRGAAA